MYSSITNTWSDLPSMNVARYAHVSIGMDNRVHILGGVDHALTLESTMESLEVGNKEWAFSTPLLHGITMPIIARIGANIYSVLRPYTNKKA